jgi:hypothetical protein
LISVTFWCGSGPASPTNGSGSDLVQTPDPTPFFSYFKDAKKYFFPYFFSYNLPTGTLFSVLKNYFFGKILC